MARPTWVSISAPRFFFFARRGRHTIFDCDWSSDVCSSDLTPDTWKPAIEAQRDLYYAGLEILTPGRPFAEFMDFVNTFGEKRGLKSLMLMHGRGYGDDGPLFTPQNRGARNRDVLIEKGNVFIVKPIVSRDRKSVV